MHDTAYDIGTKVMRTYLPSHSARVLEVGALNVNGSLRDSAPRGVDYVGIDFEAGPGVDLVVTTPEDWPVPDNHFDLVMASSVFEHDEAFWQTFLAMVRKTRLEGHIYVSAPSNGTVHRYPRDFWRFYPDAGLALVQWAQRNGFEIDLVESFVAERQSEVYNDFCAVFRKGPSGKRLNSNFVHDQVPAVNVLTWETQEILKATPDPEDVRLIVSLRDQLHRLHLHVQHIQGQFDAKETSLGADIAQLSASAQAAESEVARLSAELEQVRGAAEQLAESEQKCRELEENWAQASAELGSLRQELQEAEARLAQVAAERDGFAQRIETSETGNREAAVLMQDLQRQLDEAVAAHDGLDGERKALVGRLAEMESHLEQRRAELASVWDELAASKEAAAAAELKAEALLVEISEVREKLRESDGWVYRLAGERREAELEQARKDVRLQRLAKEVASLEARIARFEESEAVEANRAQQIAELSQSLAETEARLSDAEARLQLASAEATTLRPIATQGTVGIDVSSADDLRALRRQLLESQSECLAAKDTIQDRFREIAEITRLLRACEERRAELEQAVALRDAKLGELGAAAAARSAAEISPRESERRLRREEGMDRLRKIYLALAKSPRWWALLPNATRRRREIDYLKVRGLFDGDEYLRRNPDVAASGMSPIQHYVAHGIDEGREF